MERKISPTNDFLFKCLFGRKGCEDTLLPFLNAIMQNSGQKPFKSIEIIENKELPKEKTDDKLCIIDIRAKTQDNTIINIEIQVNNQRNMEKRTLYYWSKLYNEHLKSGQDYRELNKVVTINLIDFSYFNDIDYHDVFKVMSVKHPMQLLTDDLEIHFIQLPKYRKLNEKDYSHNSLHRWLTFLQKEVPDQLLKELIIMDTNLKMAHEKLETLLSDEETISQAWERERAILEYNSLMSSAREEGREEGREEERKIQEAILTQERQKQLNEKLDSAKKLMNISMSVEEISEILGLSIEEIRSNLERL